MDVKLPSRLFSFADFRVDCKAGELRNKETPRGA